MSTTKNAKVVVIAGASAGIGHATAIRFAQDGAKIALLARGRAGLDGAKADVEAAGGQALIISTDMADAAEAGADGTRGRTRLGRSRCQARRTGDGLGAATGKAFSSCAGKARCQRRHAARSL